MRAIIALCGSTALAALLALWFLLEWRSAEGEVLAEQRTVRELREARQRDANLAFKQTERTGQAIVGMATACRGEGESAFDRGYNLGVARCGLPPQF